MKRLILPLLLLVITCSLKAQNTYIETPGRWRLGLNMGAVWMNSDVKTIPSIGGGFNIEKILNKRPATAIGMSLGFRYLSGRTYGISNDPSYDIKNNKLLNGTYDSTLRYDSVPGYFYGNHKTYVQEGALEFKVNFPRLEQQSHLILHLWGGIGVAKYKTWIDARDNETGKMYDFTPLKGQTANESDINRILDGKYESLAQGSDPSGTYRFVPSCGVGIGVRFSKNVALVFEHKMSFPLTDYMDGYAYDNSACPNDRYHYTGANLIFTMYGKTKGKGTTTQNNNNVYTNNTNTVTTTNTNTAVVTTNNTNTVTTSTTGTATVNVPKVTPPAVVITYPPNNFNSQYDNVSVSTKLTNITSSQQIGITLNGHPLQHFSFNPQNGMLNFQSFLALGSNYFVVTGTNQGGTASDAVNVNYNPTSTLNIPTNTVTVNTNTVVITNTVVPTNTVATTTTVTPVHTNTVITSTGGGTVSINPTNTVVTTNTVITSTGSGTVATTNTVAATNTTVVTSTGTGTVATTNTVVSVGTGTVGINPTGTVVTTNPTGTVVGTNPTFTVAPTGKPPVVQIINPSVNPHNESKNSYNVSGSVLNIDNSNQLKISVNGTAITQFTLGQNNKMLNFWVSLQPGQNTVTIKATNNFGSDSKSTVINYKPAKPPKVVISTPASSPYTSLNANTSVTGFVYGVQSSSNISVTANGATTNFNYNPSNNSIAVPLTLVKDVNTQVMITGTNESGSDAASATLVYRVTSTGIGIDSGKTSTVTTTTTSTGMGGLPRPPAITVITPSSDPYNSTNTSEGVVASITFITNPANVTVKTGGGVAVPSSFNMGTKQVTFTAQLVSGANTFVISASNNFGNASKSLTINYAPPVNNGGNGGGNNDPQITICHIPPGNPNNPQQITIPTSAWPAHQAHGDTQGACQTNNGNGNNGGGNGNGNNGGGNNDPQITICHIPPGNPNNPQQITIPTSAWPAHQAHGDTQGPCQNNNNGNGNNGGGNGNGNNNGGNGNGNGGGNQQITICHIPPGNPNNPQQITIPASAWPAHQAHGDTQGPCQNNNNGNGNGNGGKPGNGNQGNGGGNNGGGLLPKLGGAGGIVIPGKGNAPKTEPKKEEPKKEEPKKEEPKNEGRPRIITTPSVTPSNGGSGGRPTGGGGQ